MARSDAIASGSVTLTANADGLKTGLEAAARDVDGWGKRVARTAAAGAGRGGALANLMGGVSGGGAFLTAGGPAGIALAGIGKAANLAADGVRAAVGTLDDLARQGNIARSLGLTAEQFTGMAGVAKSVGEDTREFLESLVTMGKLGTDAAAGTEQASAAFKALGLNANEFIKLKADQQFFQIFDSLQKVGDPLQRTRLLMQAFGEDGGKYLLPLLSKTPGQLREMAAGFAVTGEEMTKATRATQAVASLKTSAEKIWREFAVAVAPLVESLAKDAIKLIEFFKPTFDWMLRMIDRVARGFEDLKSVFDDSWASKAARFVGILDPKAKKPEPVRPINVGPVGPARFERLGAEALKRGLDEADERAKKLGAGVGGAIGAALAQQLNPVELAGAMARGSKEAYSVVVKNRLRDTRAESDPAKQMVRAQKDGNKKLGAIDKGIDAVGAKLDKLGVI